MRRSLDEGVAADRNEPKEQKEPISGFMPRAALTSWR